MNERTLLINWCRSCHFDPLISIHDKKQKDGVIYYIKKNIMVIFLLMIIVEIIH